MSSTQAKDIELATWNYVRKQYESKGNKYRIPIALKYLIQRFANRIIGCRLLSIAEDLKFHKLLISKLSSTAKYKLIFRASENGYSAQKFHENCDNKGATLTIIKSNWGNIFGGYVSKSWTPNKASWMNDT